MKIGSFLSLNIIDPATNKVVKYQSRIIGKDKNYFFIDYPINIKTRKAYHLREDTTAIATYVEANKTPYSFPIKVIKKIQLTVPALAIKYPKRDLIKKIQRRRHVRVETAIDIAVHSPEALFSPFTTVTSDISAGGTSIILPKNIELIKVNNLHIWLVLPMASGEYHYISSESKLIRIVTKEHKRKTLSLKFISLEPNEKEAIVQFCFEKQRQSRQKGIYNI